MRSEVRVLPGPPLLGSRHSELGSRSEYFGSQSYDCQLPAADCLYGAIAQLGERVLCKHEVVGSIPSGSTRRLIADRLPRRGARQGRPALAPYGAQPGQKSSSIESFAVSSDICGLSNIVKRKHIWMLT